jgi:hypothetical protein
MAQAEKHLPSKCKALSSNSNTTPQKIISREITEWYLKGCLRRLHQIFPAFHLWEHFLVHKGGQVTSPEHWFFLRIDDSRPDRLTASTTASPPSGMTPSESWVDDYVMSPDLWVRRHQAQYSASHSTNKKQTTRDSEVVVNMAQRCQCCLTQVLTSRI